MILWKNISIKSIESSNCLVESMVVLWYFIIRNINTDRGEFCMKLKKLFAVLSVVALAGSMWGCKEKRVKNLR